MGGQLQTADWQLVIEKGESRLDGWQTRLLSRSPGGKGGEGIGTFLYLSYMWVLESGRMV